MFLNFLDQILSIPPPKAPIYRARFRLLRPEIAVLAEKLIFLSKRAYNTEHIFDFPPESQFFSQNRL